MTLADSRSGIFVVPGEKIAVIEEFIPSLGTFDDNGAIRSQLAGFVVIDSVSRTVSVLRRGTRPKVPRRGEIVVGQVSTTEGKLATVNIFKVGKDFVQNPLSGWLYITRIGKGYVKKLDDAVKPGDLVRGKIISNKNGVCQVTTIGNPFGVIQAYCSSCGRRLTPIRRGKLVCGNCRKTETRKIAEGYGLPRAR